MNASYTVPGMTGQAGEQAAQILQQRLVTLLDLALTLKHIHWNVVGPNFIAVHEMLDPQVDAVREMADTVAERVATLGSEPVGTPGYVVEQRAWDDYKLARATTEEHLSELDRVYVGVIEDHRKAIRELEQHDLVSQSLLLNQAEQLEMFHWFVRAHLEDRQGRIQGQRA